MFSTPSYRLDLQYCCELNYMFGLVVNAAAQCGYSVDRVDNFNYTISLSTSMSATSWGENIVVTMGILPDGRTGITFVSTSNMGSGKRAVKQNQKAIETLVNMINNYLR